MSAVTRRRALSLIPAAGATLALSAAPLVASNPPANGITPALAAILAEHDAIADEYRAGYAAAQAEAGSKYVPDEAMEELTDGLHEAIPAFNAILAFVPLTMADVRAKAGAVLMSPCSPELLDELSSEEITAFVRSLAGEA